MADERRILRMQSRIQRDIAEIFQRDLKDPRMKGLITVTRVKVARDLGHARIFYTVLGTKGQRSSVEKFLQSARPFIQRAIASGLEIRISPIVEFTYEYYLAHQYFVRIVVAENQARGRHFRKSKAMRTLNRPIIDRLARVIERGQAEGLFRADADPVEIHKSIAALGMFNVTNQYTFGSIFQREMGAKGDVGRRRSMVADLILSYLTRGGSS